MGKIFPKITLIFGICLLSGQLFWIVDQKEDFFFSKNTSTAFKQDSSFLVNLNKTTQTNDQVVSTSTETSKIRKFFGAIGSFFALIGQGISSGIAASARFVALIVVAPFKGLVSIFRSDSSGSGASRSTDSSVQVT